MCGVGGQDESRAKLAFEVDTSFHVMEILFRGDKTLGTLLHQGLMDGLGKPSERLEETESLPSGLNRFEGCASGKGRSHRDSSISEDLGRNLIPREGRGGNEAVPECSSPLSFPTEQQDVIASKARVTWCAVGSEEKRKCDQWNRVSGGRITCASFPATEDCIVAIMVRSRCHTYCGRQRAS